MSTSVLSRALGIRGYKHQSIREQDGGITLRVRHDGTERNSPQCGGSNISRRGIVPRRWPALPIGNRPVTVLANVPRTYCFSQRSRFIHSSYSWPHYSLSRTTTLALSPWAFSPTSACNASPKSLVEIPLRNSQGINSSIDSVRLK